MWNHIINIHSSELLSTKTKKSRINESLKKKKCFTKKKKKIVDNLYFIPNNHLTIFFSRVKKI